MIGLLLTYVATPILAVIGICYVIGGLRQHDEERAMDERILARRRGERQD